MSKQFLGWVLIFFAGLQLYIALKIVNLKKIKDVADETKKLNMFSRAIQVLALIFVVIFLFDGCNNEWF